MNQVHDIQKLTIAEAANHPALCSISIEDIATDQETITASIAKFVWLRALDPDGDAELLKTAETDVHEDG